VLAVSAGDLGLLPEVIRPNGNVATRRPQAATVAYDWPELHVDPLRVVIRRGTSDPTHPLAERVVAVFEGDALEVADYLTVLAEVVAEIAGGRKCRGCGFYFEPGVPGGDPARRSADEWDCGRCVE
jgi:hypothetical protein